MRGELEVGVAAGGRGALSFGFGRTRRGSRPGMGASEIGRSEGAPFVVAAEGDGAGGGIDPELAGAGSPRSRESSLRVSRSIALNASHDDSAVTSIVRWSASGEPIANN